MSGPATDPEWAARIVDHRARRPAHWSTIETSDVAGAAQRVGAIMIDCLGTWLTAVIDRLGTWDEPLARWQGDFHDQLQDLIKAWQARRGLAVAVTNEVGWGLVSRTALAGCSPSCWGWSTRKWPPQAMR